MNRPVLVNVAVSVAIAVGSFLQGWVIATLYADFPFSKMVFPLGSAPIWGGHVGDGLVCFVGFLVEEGLVLYVLLIGMATAKSAGTTDWLGGRTLLINTTLFHFLSSVMILWSADHFVLLASRLLSAFGVGFSVISLGIYLREIPPRGFVDDWLLCIGISCGSRLCDVVMDSSGWRLILEVTLALSILYIVLIVLLLPESPKWLASKGNLVVAKHVLQILHDEMYMLVYGFRLEDDLEYGPEDVSSEKPVTVSTAAAQQGSMERSQNASLMDSLLTPSAASGKC